MQWNSKEAKENEDKAYLYEAERQKDYPEVFFVADECFYVHA